MSKAPTVYDVADRAGVSIATVSRVLRTPGAVRPETRDRVLLAVSELGYVPSGSARGLAERRTGVVGLYFPGFDAVDEIADLDVLAGSGRPERPFTVVRGAGPHEDTHASKLFQDEVLRGAELEAWRRGLVLMVGVGRGDPAASIARDMAGRVDGLVVLASSIPDDALERLARRVPVVVLSGPRVGDRHDHVTVSNTEAMAELTRHVLAQTSGRAPAYLAGPEDSPDGGQRWQGFREAIAAAGLPVDRVEVLRGDHTRASGRRVGEELVRRGLPAALMSSNDQMALGVLDAFREARVRVPDDVVVTGFDGIDAAALSSPPLTTVRQPMLELGRAAIQVLARRLAAPTAAPMSVSLPVEVLLRDSSDRGV
ncbi:LacI family DNA-binding transcriptional regulator [Microbacterium oryzae]|uniref:LacI family DNA-binding transcriptional regulator n=1 Tax=Microbacterium oryzae TaxID=743009 RepID=UPI0025B1A16F|nr:LacI family DNA-binding transcriptional regulator [Microbacterium oryzae]MDN3309829.1 LacI family DNA-binding transcriptional regulator [Microbacterium oryzae]